MPGKEYLPPELESEINKIEFKKRLSSFDQEDTRQIMFAYDLAMTGHKEQKRTHGGPYFDHHVREVALILLDECHIKDPNIIIGSLLHDAGEDTAIFGDLQEKTLRRVDNKIIKTQIKYSEWVNEARQRAQRTFNPEVAEILIADTKPKPDLIEIPDKETALKIHYENLRKASPKAILIKMADRLHNLRTLGSEKPKKRKRKIKETQEILCPIFTQTKTTYPNEANYLLSEIHKSIGIAQKNL